MDNHTASIHWSKMKNDQKRKYSRSRRWWKPIFDGLKPPLTAQTACCAYSKGKANGPLEGRKRLRFMQCSALLLGKSLRLTHLCLLSILPIYINLKTFNARTYTSMRNCQVAVVVCRLSKISHFLQMSRADTSLFRSGLPFETRCSSGVSPSFSFAGLILSHTY